MNLMNEKKAFQFCWVIVGGQFYDPFSDVSGLVLIFSLFRCPFLKEFGWSRSIAAGAFSLCMIIHNVMVLSGSSFLGIGLALCSFTQTWWQFYLFFGVITAIGIGATGWVPNVTLIQ